MFINVKTIFVASVSWSYQFAYLIKVYVDYFYVYNSSLYNALLNHIFHVGAAGGIQYLSLWIDNFLMTNWLCSMFIVNFALYLLFTIWIPLLWVFRNYSSIYCILNPQPGFYETLWDSHIVCICLKAERLGIMCLSCLAHESSSVCTTLFHIWNHLVYSLPTILTSESWKSWKSSWWNKWWLLILRERQGTKW